MSKSTKSEPKSKPATNPNNPFRAGGAYHGVVETLRKLGLGKMHGADAILKTYPAVVGAAAWKAFASKDARNDETGKDAKQRVLQNCGTLCRNDYGAPLRAIGMEIRKDRDDGPRFGLFRLDKAAAQKAAAKSKPQKAASKPKASKGPKAAPKARTPQKANQSDQRRSKGKAKAAKPLQADSTPKMDATPALSPNATIR